MSYQSWFISHGKKHKAIVEKLSNLNDNELIEYFRYENMVKNEPDFCPLYEDNNNIILTYDDPSQIEEITKTLYACEDIINNIVACDEEEQGECECV